MLIINYQTNYKKKNYTLKLLHAFDDQYLVNPKYQQHLIHESQVQRK